MNIVATGAKIRVLVVDDSPVARELLAHILNGAPETEVIGVANDGEAAVREAGRLRPDVIVMDIHLPGLDGFAATRKIMETWPTRIVMATATTDPKEVAANFHAMEAGALSVLAKPRGVGHPDFAADAEELVRTVRLMSEVPVVKRWPRGGRASHAPAGVGAGAVNALRIVAIGASTGGPIALQRLLSELPKDFPVPIVIVQHISDSFVDGLTEWLADTTGYRVRIAAGGEPARPGVAYVAPSGRHMQVQANGTIALVDGPKEHGVRPSVSVLFRSVVASFGAAHAGVLLTGMGRDGACELKAMREAGGITFAQDRESSVVFGMPGEAVTLDAARYVLSPEQIAAVLVNLVAGQEMPLRK
ncbi:two-component system, chemotaxis family, response regulator CheB [Aromatoleum tolulyticum]|uniref:Protein-glutamate methylesterase/protein-glutamine glutaminase n=1 Tax=Aromatoleum tolulyticum TaxID=34027 RepID=A0A1N6N411_9RHOO|nr:chemotaxis-specific protein-glutamate methyltransferase CheB [Aromatoleum tolulyticum]SIP86814.1 two-component system, chemotaxis family, response regulator CheB [Aromatoleum tolulyticum]